ncbi:MAG TPA: DUF427 domain-containing protein [Gaiella sp.]|nr:DUF427 domain-containing protein [Gaiella sp.]
MSSTRSRQASPRGRVRVERGEKRVRAYLGGELVADTSRPLLVWEKPYYPTYYFRAADVRTDLLLPDGGTAHSPSRGDGHTYEVRAGGKAAPGAALQLDESPFEELRGAIRLDWHAMDAWFEEDEQVFTHPRDPYTRVDILPSSRHVRVEAGGVTLAETSKPTLLFETNLPTRYYLPRTHIRMELLVPSETATHCPYKGEARYWSLRDDGPTDIAWSYTTPLPESQKIAGLVAFYTERVDLYVDGVPQGG